jgi:hypothetical protein
MDTTSQITSVGFTLQMGSWDKAWEQLSVLYTLFELCNNITAKVEGRELTQSEGLTVLIKAAMVVEEALLINASLAQLTRH